MRNGGRQCTARARSGGRTGRSRALGGSGLRGGTLRVAAGGAHRGRGWSRGLPGSLGHCLTVFRAGLAALHRGIGRANGRRKGTARTGRAGGGGGLGTAGGGGLRGRAIGVTPRGIHIGGGLRSGLRGGGGGHRRIENGVADFLAHFLHGGIFAIEGNGQLLFAAAGFALAFDEPVFFVNIPTGEQRGNEQDKQPEHYVPPPDAEPIGQGFKTPFDEFQNSSESNFHKRF